MREAFRRLARSLLVPGAGALFTPPTRRRLLAALAGAVLTAVLDMAGVAAMVPLLQIISGIEGGVVLESLASILGPDASRRSMAIFLAVLIVALYTAKAILTLSFRWWQMGFIAREQVRTSTRLLRGYLAAPYRLFLDRGTPEYIRSLGDALSQTYTQVVLGALGAATEILTIAAIATLVLFVSPIPALVAFLYFAVSAALLNRLVKAPTKQAGEDVLEHSMRAFHVVLNTLGGAKEIKIRNNAETFVDTFGRSQRDVALATRRFNFFSEVPKHVLELLFVGGVALMTVFAVSSASAADALAQLVLFAAAGTRILPSTVRLLTALNSVRFGLPGLAIVVEDLHKYPAVSPSADGDRRLPAGELRLDHVSYRYDEHGPLVVDDVDVVVPRGTSLAVVGSSGAGKTTLIDLLLGLLTPTSGAVTLDGRDLADDLPAWQRSIGLVPQAPYLFDDTLAANITFGLDVDEADRERLLGSVSRAALDSVVAELPRGLDTVLGERGSRLSGGQAQRIGIARALFLDPTVIVLDEATSALDTVTEAEISRAIANLKGSVTVVIVAHRLSTVRTCDQLLFLEDGRAAGLGTFEEVRAANPAFARMVELGAIDPPAVSAD